MNETTRVLDGIVGGLTEADKGVSAASVRSEIVKALKAAKIAYRLPKDPDVSDRLEKPDFRQILLTKDEFAKIGDILNPWKSLTMTIAPRNPGDDAIIAVYGTKKAKPAKPPKGLPYYD